MRLDVPRSFILMVYFRLYFANCSNLCFSLQCLLLKAFYLSTLLVSHYLWRPLKLLHSGGFHSNDLSLPATPYSHSTLLLSSHTLVLSESQYRATIGTVSVSACANTTLLSSYRAETCLTEAPACKHLLLSLQLEPWFLVHSSIMSSDSCVICVCVESTWKKP